jgi:hypothetical protein
MGLSSWRFGSAGAAGRGRARRSVSGGASSLGAQGSGSRGYRDAWVRVRCRGGVLGGRRMNFQATAVIPRRRTNEEFGGRRGIGQVGPMCHREKNKGKRPTRHCKEVGMRVRGPLANTCQKGREIRLFFFNFEFCFLSLTFLYINIYIHIYIYIPKNI